MPEPSTAATSVQAFGDMAGILGPRPATRQVRLGLAGRAATVAVRGLGRGASSLLRSRGAAAIAPRPGARAGARDRCRAARRGTPDGELRAPPARAPQGPAGRGHGGRPRLGGAHPRRDPRGLPGRRDPGRGVGRASRPWWTRARADHRLRSGVARSTPLTAPSTTPTACPSSASASAWRSMAEPPWASSTTPPATSLRGHRRRRRPPRRRTPAHAGQGAPRRLPDHARPAAAAAGGCAARRILRATRVNRVLGSSALALAYVANGRFDAFIQARGLSNWDVGAAGSSPAKPGPG